MSSDERNRGQLGISHTWIQFILDTTKVGEDYEGGEGRGGGGAEAAVGDCRGGRGGKGEVEGGGGLGGCHFGGMVVV